MGINKWVHTVTWAFLISRFIAFIIIPILADKKDVCFFQVNF